MPRKTPNILLIIGQGRSGSTLLDSILDSHSGIVGVGEISRYHRALEQDEDCGCGRKVRACPFWNHVFTAIDPSVSKMVYRKPLDRLLGRVRYVHPVGLGIEPVDIKEYQLFNEELYQKLSEVAGKLVVSDSSKSVDRATILAGDASLGIGILHLVRDGRAVTNSYVKANQYKQDSFRFMRQWMLTNLRIEALHKQYPDLPYLRVRYEDLVRDPHATLGKIAAFAGVPYEASMLDYGSREHHLIGGNRKFHNKKARIIAEDLSWQTELSLFSRFLFGLGFGWLNRRYGYNAFF